MSTGDVEWIRQGEGNAPRLSWTFATEAPLVSMQLARETGELLAADAAGGLSMLTRQGKLAGLVRGRSPLRAVAWSDTGAGGVSLVGDDKLYWFNRQLTAQGAIDLPEPSLAVALESHGNYAAVSLNDGTTLLYNVHRKLIAHFDTSQPLVSLYFLLTVPAVVGVTEYGLLCCHGFDGTRLWEEKLWGNVGDLAVTGDGATILLACFTLGIQAHNADGALRGSYQVGGTVCRVSCSAFPHRIAAATLERHFYWLDLQGKVEWQAILPDDICRVICDPFGTGVICGFQSGRIVRLDWDAA